MPHGQITPYRGTRYDALVRAGLRGAGIAENPEIAAAARAARFAYRNRGKFKKGARMFQRAYRSYRSRNPTTRIKTEVLQTGKASGNTPSIGGEAADCYYTTLYTGPFPWPQSDPDANRQNGRTKNTIFLKGIKICRQFYVDVSEVASQPLQLNYCILQWKGDEELIEINDQIKQGFFRSHSDAENRSYDFVDNTAANVLFDTRYTCSPMNPDKNFRIIKRMKFMMGNKIYTSNAAQEYPCLQNIDFYLKVNKSFTFQSNSASAPHDQLFECWWISPVNNREDLTNPVTGARIRTHKMNTMYFDHDR